MLPLFFLTALISTSVSVPTPDWPPSPPYVSFCASALYDWNYRWFAGLFPWDRCDEIFFNMTRGEYQPAIAYNIKKGAWCKFYEYVSYFQHQVPAGHSQPWLIRLETWATA